MTVADVILEVTGTAADAHDIRAILRKCYFYDFDGAPLRLWDGVGKLYAGGFEWLGTIDAAGSNHHRSPTLRDLRDGVSPRYEFTIPYLDKANFDAMKADQAMVRGRPLTIYHVCILIGEGLRPTNPLRFKTRLEMKGAKFAESVTGSAGSLHVTRSASIVARGGEDGRSRIPNGTYTDTAQRERARVLGLASDSGCSFVAGNSRRTYVVGG